MSEEETGAMAGTVNDGRGEGDVVENGGESRDRGAGYGAAPRGFDIDSGEVDRVLHSQEPVVREEEVMEALNSREGPAVAALANMATEHGSARCVLVTVCQVFHWLWEKYMYTIR